MTFDELKCELAREYGWSFAVIDDMSWEQIDIACRRGKPAKGIAIRSDAEARSVARDWRRIYGI